MSEVQTLNLHQKTVKNFVEIIFLTKKKSNLMDLTKGVV